MSVDKKIDDLIAALDRNTAALLASGGSAPAAAPAAESTKKGKKTEAAETKSGPKHDQAEVNAALIALKDTFGAEHAKAIIKDVGGVDKMSDIKEDKYDAVFDAAKAKHAELTSAAEDNAI